MARIWQEFQEVVHRALRRRYWGLEIITSQEKKRHSRPDFVIKEFWLIFTIVVDAKHKEKVTTDDIDKLVRDSKTHDATWTHLYISTETELPEHIAQYAGKNDVEIYRLGWNGNERRLV